MLARANRIVSATDFRRLVRSGRRSRGAVVLAYGTASAPEAPLRLGVIVARNVGKAVVRNRVRRRIKAVGWSIAQETAGLDVVIRALPGAATADFAVIDTEVRHVVAALAVRAR